MSGHYRSPWLVVFEKFGDAYVSPNPCFERTRIRILERDGPRTTPSIDEFLLDLKEAGFPYYVSSTVHTSDDHLDVFEAIIRGDYEPLRGKWTVFSGLGQVVSLFADERDAIVFRMRLDLSN